MTPVKATRVGVGLYKKKQLVHGGGGQVVCVLALYNTSLNPAEIYNLNSVKKCLKRKKINEKMAGPIQN